MLDELETIGLAAAARELGCEPKDVVQLAVASRGGLGASPLKFSRVELEKLRALGGVEPGWWASATLPDDDSPLRARVRAAVKMLQVRGFVGDRQTRMDNLWRGLPADERESLRDALAALVEDEVLVSRGSPTGILVSVDPGSAVLVQDLVSGHSTPDALKAVLGE